MFDLITPMGSPSPVIVSVPHAGRAYPIGMAEMLRVPLAKIVTLEDRHVDLLAAGLPATGTGLIIARTPRAWIDLNRAEGDFDPAMIDPPIGLGKAPSTKVRGGLGLVPRRLSGMGDLWRGPISKAELDQRITEVHRPYHAALSALLEDRRARFGVAVLIDLHSMPPIVSAGSAAGPDIVIGDRFGQSAGARFTSRLRSECEAAALRVAENSPYPGGHLIESHGAPGRGIHALQIEIDRRLYLKPDLMDPDRDGLRRMSGLLCAIATALAEEALGGSLSIAAE
jgi:N-formylglutamate amidohydrolase